MASRVVVPWGWELGCDAWVWTRVHFKKSGVAAENSKTPNLSKIWQIVGLIGSFLEISQPENPTFRPLFEYHHQKQPEFRQFRQIHRPNSTLVWTQILGCQSKFTLHAPFHCKLQCVAWAAAQVKADSQKAPLFKKISEDGEEG